MGLEDRKYARWANENINLNVSAIIVDNVNGIAKLTSNMIGARVVCENYDGEKLFTNVYIQIKSGDIFSKNIMAIIK